MCNAIVDGRQNASATRGALEALPASGPVQYTHSLAVALSQAGPSDRNANRKAPIPTPMRPSPVDLKCGGHCQWPPSPCPCALVVIVLSPDVQCEPAS
jgi:hypothetical protein